MSFESESPDQELKIGAVGPSARDFKQGWPTHTNREDGGCVGCQPAALLYIYAGTRAAINKMARWVR